jgi:hypothetical protein
MLHSIPLGKTHKRLIALIVFLASLAGCTMGTSTTGNGPSGISATTLSPTSIRVYWTRDPTDLSTDTVIVMLGTTVVGTSTASYLGATIDSALITGLASNVPYTIIIATASIRSQPVNYTLQLTYLPTNVAVIAQTLNSITVSWTRNDSDLTPDTLIVTTSTGALLGLIVVPPGSSTAMVTGIVTGTTYVIVVGTLTGRSNAIMYSSPYPGNLMVNAMNASSIGAVWTRGVADVGIDTIFAMSGNTVVAMDTTSGSSGIVTGLSEMVPYVLSIHTDSGTSDTITWMTAERDTGIHIYEMADTILTDSVGLQLAANATKSIPIKGATNADFVLMEDKYDSSGISFNAGFLANSNWNNTKISADSIFIPGGLNNYYRDTNYATAMSGLMVDSVAIPNDASLGSRILICQTVSGNLALIEIVPNASTGQLYSVNPTSGFKYITVNVSYQALANAPYAGRGHAHSTKPVLKLSAGNVKPVSKNRSSNVKPITKTPAQ